MVVVEEMIENAQRKMSQLYFMILSPIILNAKFNQRLHQWEKSDPNPSQNVNASEG